MVSSHLRLALASACFLTISSIGALAQAQPKPAPAAPVPPAPAAAAPAAPAPGPVQLVALGEWIKVCGTDQVEKKEVCYTTRDFGQVADQPPVLALAVYDIKGNKQRVMRMLMPVGLMLRPGFRFSLDKGAQLSGGFEICCPNGCFAEAKIEAATVDSMKKATLLNVTVQNQGGSEVTFSVPLANFGKFFDGPAIDPKVLEEQQKLQGDQLQQEMLKRADEERKRLEGGAAAPAPVFTPPPAKP